jgi:hypothetical protein
LFVILFFLTLLVSSFSQSAGWFDKSSKKEKDGKSDKGKQQFAKAMFEYDRLPMFWGYVVGREKLSISFSLFCFLLYSDELFFQIVVRRSSYCLENRKIAKSIFFL